MLFNSFEFALFLPLVFLLYWFVVNKNLKSQNAFLAAVSYFFYGWWDWRFLILIAFTSFCSYYTGIWINHFRTSKPSFSKWFTVGNITINLLILCIFKYFNFFSENLIHLFRIFGFELDWVTINILLPVGISFYTFQALSYTIDVYKGKINATHDIVSFFAFISFFPQLVAGPIERATNLLPQFFVKRKFDYNQAVLGMRQILWGLFKKIVVADNCAIAVNKIFETYPEQNGSTLIMGALLFTFQIYGDFSGYSDIAIGTARLFGFNLMRNFSFPYFSRDIAEFWRRWHISLTTWFRDYIYIPLGGSRRTKWMSFRNTMIIFLLSGLWHGANWTFIVWGAYHALLFLPLLLIGKNRKYMGTIAENKLFPSVKELFQMLFTFTLVVIGWIIFRAPDLSQAVGYITNIFTQPFFPVADIGKKVLVFPVLLIVIEWLGRNNQFALEKMPFSNKAARWSMYLLLIIVMIFFGGEQDAFIYFQF